MSQSESYGKAPLAISDSRKQSRQLEIYYGKTGVLVERWSEDLGHLAYGKPLAKSILVCLVSRRLAAFSLTIDWLKGHRRQAGAKTGSSNLFHVTAVIKSGRDLALRGPRP